MSGKKLITRFFRHNDGRLYVISYPDAPTSSDRSVWIRENGDRVARELRFGTTVEAVARAMSKMRTLWAQGYRPANANGTAPRESAAGDRPRVLWYSERRAGPSSILAVDVLTTRPEQFVPGAVPDWLDIKNVIQTTEPRRITGIKFLPRRPVDAADAYRVRVELTGPLAPSGSFAELLESLRARIAAEPNPVGGYWSGIWAELQRADGVTPAIVRAAFRDLQAAYRDRISADERQRRIAERAAEIAAADQRATAATEAAVRSEVERIRTERDFGTTQRRINLDD